MGTKRNKSKMKRRPLSIENPVNSRVQPISQLRFNCDTTTTRRYHDAFDYDESDRNYDMRSIQLRYDYDTTTTKN